MADTSKYIIGFTEGGEWRFGSSFLIAGVRISGPYIPDLPKNISFYHNISAVSPSGKIAYIIKASPSSTRMSQVYKINSIQKKYFVSKLFAPFPQALSHATDDSVEIQFSSFSYKNRLSKSAYLVEFLDEKALVSTWYEQESFYSVGYGDDEKSIYYDSGNYRPQFKLEEKEYIRSPSVSPEGRIFYAMIEDIGSSRTKPYDFYGRLVRVDANDKTVKQIPLKRRYSEPRILALDNDRVLLKDKEPHGNIVFSKVDFREEAVLEML